METSLILERLPALASYTEVQIMPYVEKAHSHLPLPEIEEGAYLIREARMEGLREKLAKLAKRAEKLGLDAPGIDIVETFTVPVIKSFLLHGGWSWARSKEAQTFHVIKASATPVALAGWRFAATIEHLGAEGNLLRTAPGFEIPLPMSYRSDKPTCNHCGLSRRRAATFVLHHESNGFTRVGRNCLADFIGDQNANNLVQLASMAEAVADLLSSPDDEMGGGYGFGGAQAVDAESFLVLVAQVIGKVGWLSRKVAKETEKVSTASMAWDVVFAKKPSEDVKALRAVEPTDAHKEDAKNALAWAKALPKEVESDFLYNIRLISHLPCWDNSKIGLGAAIVMSYQKEQERLKRMEFERKLPSVYMGAVGSKYGGKGKGNGTPVAARVLGVHTFDGDYGLTTIVRMQAPCNETTVHDLVWFASGEVQVVVDAEAIKEAVAAHNTYNRLYGAYCDAHSKVHDGYWTWLRSREQDAPFVEQSTWEKAEGAPLVTIMDDAQQAMWTASKAKDAAEANAKDAKRSVKAGDAIWLSGGVKKQEVSKKTQRPETTMTRCALALREE